MRVDYHVHTIFSDDSECTMEDMVKRALVIGLDEIAFTEHVDYGVKTDLNCSYDEYFPEIRKMQEKYGERIRIKAGIEFGVQLETISAFENDFNKYEFDFVILSNHQIRNKEFWNQEFQKGKTQDEIQQAYYKAILEVVEKYNKYSVLGHLDMIKRYDLFGEYPDEKNFDTIEKILKQVIHDEKGIELNTSCFKYGLKDLTPSKKILELYYELGGRILTLGSDSHERIHLGEEIEEVKPILKEIGFREFCTFDKMLPRYHAL